jgi:hypothetical protein
LTVEVEALRVELGTIDVGYRVVYTVVFVVRVSRLVEVTV